MKGAGTNIWNGAGDQSKGAFPFHGLGKFKKVHGVWQMQYHSAGNLTYQGVQQANGTFGGKLAGLNTGDVVGHGSGLVKTGVQYTKPSLKLGQEMHKAYHAGKVGKEFRLPSGKRIDFLDIDHGTIYELKPFNPGAMKAGQKQLDMYLKELQTMPRFKGIQWKTVLDTY